MRNILVCCMILCGMFLNSRAIVPPKDGGSLPPVYFDVTSKGKQAFTLQGGWIQKTQAAKAAREAFEFSKGFDRPQAVPSEMMVSGTFQIPVFTVRYANRTAPYASANLQTELFTGPWPTGTMTDYYGEVSYGNLTVTGTVYNWTTASQNDTYYEGTSYGLEPGNAHTGELIREILDANDAAVDFGQFDNDGPDGVPNSGDDNGYVDFIAIVHPEVGAECGPSTYTNIWSHSWILSAWPVLGYNPYVTNDPRTGGGFIRVNDYTIQPALACDGSTMIQIGVFCHEFGHAFGLPDLYDVDGGAAGIGYWGLMGSGNWNTPASPAHFSAWSKLQLGWLTKPNITWEGSVRSVPQVEFNSTAYAFWFTDEWWRRASDCAISGAASLRCGLSETQGAARNWMGGGGYGNDTKETIQHDFIFDGTTPVTFSYDYHYETEPDYDYAYTVIEVNGNQTYLATYNGLGSGTENLNLSSILSVYTPPVRYRLRFEFFSDYAWSDEDGGAQTTCGAFIVDNMSVTGGGENYSTDFEQFEDGWYQDPSRNWSSEYWLVENRQKVGFDANLLRAGLLVWHCDDDVMWSALGNSGGGGLVSDNAVRGVVLEEADGDYDLLTTTVRGDANDPFPGLTNNTTFNSVSSPNSYNNSGAPTMIEVSSISNSGPNMTAFMRAGDEPPDAVSSTPDTVDNDQIAVDVIVDGFKMRQWSTFRFTKPGEDPIEPDTTIWVGKNRIIGNINVYSKKAGLWRLEVTNQDGQVDSIPNALYLSFKVATQLATASLDVVPGGIELRFNLIELDPGDRIVVSKARSAQGPWFEPDWKLHETSGLAYRFVDTDVEAGAAYYYRVAVERDDGRFGILYTGSITAPPREAALYQNYPNPFNPITTISYYLPERTTVDLVIYDVRGAVVRSFSVGVQSAGLKSEIWDGRDDEGRQVGSGVYVCRLKAGKTNLTRKMVLLK